ncbi:MAG: RsmE family RNA methyltransferase [Candidatus Omnitrophica bacterium]|nr:RsmE family RNA methyltransferase [Candidatus Omnitrophota bacterium]
MNSFFVDKIKANGDFVILEDPGQLHHLKDVLRLKPREKVEIFDNSGNGYIAEIAATGPREARFKIIERRFLDDQGIKLTVACAIPKNVKMDDIVDKLAQLGTFCVIPVETERVVVRLDKRKKLERLQRWRRIALSAAKQSHGCRLMQVEAVTDFKDFLIGLGDFDLKLIPTLEGKRKSLKEAFAFTGKKSAKIIVLIGPEGDFSPKELSMAKGAGFLPVSLGEQVLRVDTAAIAVAGFIRFSEPRS